MIFFFELWTVFGFLEALTGGSILLFLEFQVFPIFYRSSIISSLFHNQLAFQLAVLGTTNILDLIYPQGSFILMELMGELRRLVWEIAIDPWKSLQEIFVSEGWIEWNESAQGKLAYSPLLTFLGVKIV